MGLTYPSNKICPRCGTGGYVWYLDDSEFVAKCTNCGHYFRKQDFPMCVLDKTQKPITNYERLIHKTPEELASFMNHRACPPGENVTELCADEDSSSVPDLCNLCWLTWLKEETDK